MSTTYNIDSLYVAREDANGDIVSNPTILELCLTGNTLKEAMTYEDVKCLLSEVARKHETGSEVSGSLTFKMDADSQQFILTHTLGEATSVTDFTADVWVTATAYQKGDVVNHTDGNHSLYAYKVSGAGTSGASEPTITTGRGELITDNLVTWLVIPKLLTAVHPLSTTVPKFRLQIGLKEVGGSTTFYKQYSNLELGALPIAITGTGTYELSIDPVGGIGIDEQDTAWPGEFTTLVGATVVKAESDFYGGDCSLTQVLVDDAVDETDSVTITIDKGLTSEDKLNCRKRTSRDLKVEGNMAKEFVPEDYYSFKDKEVFDLKVNLSTKIGAYCNYHFPRVRPQFADPDLESKTSVMISPAIAAEETETAPVVTATCVFPALMSAGAIVGTGAW